MSSNPSRSRRSTTQCSIRDVFGERVTHRSNTLSMKNRISCTSGMRTGQTPVLIPVALSDSHFSKINIWGSIFLQIGLFTHACCAAIRILIACSAARIMVKYISL